MELAVDKLREPIVEALKKGVKKFVFSSPTGSGKSTRLPVIFADNIEGRILVLQPRRVAARMLAKFVAKSANSQAGGYAGWHIRSDKNFGDATKIVFLTEGILARMILADPYLKGVGAIIFDEFHERNIFSDISLALALKTLASKRPDIVLAVCSASIDTDLILKSLGENSLKLSCESRAYPIDIEYAPMRGQNERIWDKAAAEFRRVARTLPEGNILIFMPGAYEISRTISAILKTPEASKFDVLPLHGGLSSAMQDRVLEDSGKRKVIVATNIAETSLTIEGVNCVIDSGLAKVARYDKVRAVNTLFSERVSYASALQRAGRAGRTSRGLCVRLWRQSEEADFEKFLTPEILRLDLSQIILWLKSAGLELSGLPLIDIPDADSQNKAIEILKNLGALDKFGNITAEGVRMSRLPAEPRYAKMLLEGARLNCLNLAAMCAAASELKIKLDLKDERDAFERDEITADAESEMMEIIKLCEFARENRFDEGLCRRLGIHSANARTAFERARELKRQINVDSLDCERDEQKMLSKAILSAFSDRLCSRPNEGTSACALVGGKRAQIRKGSKRFASKLFVALELEEQSLAAGASIMASMLCPVQIEDLKELFAEDFSETSEVFFEQNLKRVMRKRCVKFRDLILEESCRDDATKDEIAEVLSSLVLAKKIQFKNWGDEEESFIRRVNFVAKNAPESGISAIDEEALKLIFEQLALESNSYSELKNANVMRALRAWLSREQLALLDYLAPRFVEFKTRRKPVEIRYEADLKRAVISSKFSDFFDFDERKVKICEGKVAPVFELLAPNGRPVQLTQNLGEFWKTSWPAIEKELKSRYPKHFKNRKI